MDTLRNNYLCFSEVSSLYDNTGIPKDKIQLFPVGTVKVTDYETKEVSELYCTNEMLQEIEANWRDNARGQKIPIEIKHEDSGARGWIENVQYIQNLGLFVTPDYNPLGTEELNKKIWGYASAELVKNYTNSITGKKYGIVLSGVSLTNRPVVKLITSVLQGFSENKILSTLKEVIPTQKQSMTTEEFSVAVKGYCATITNILNSIPDENFRSVINACCLMIINACDMVNTNGLIDNCRLVNAATEAIFCLCRANKEDINCEVIRGCCEAIRKCCCTVTGVEYFYFGEDNKKKDSVKSVDPVPMLSEGEGAPIDARPEEKEADLQSLSDIAGTLQDIFKVLKSHPEWTNRTGKPEAMALFKASLNKIQNFIPKEKEANSMADMTKEAEGCQKKEEGEQAPAAQNFSEEQYNKMVEKNNKEWEVKLSEEIKKVKAEAETAFNTRMQFAEAQIASLMQENWKKDDEIILSEAERDKEGKGRILPQDREKYARKLRIARAQGVIKLSETETIDSYAEAVKEIRELPVVIEYGKAYGSSHATPDQTDKKASFEEVLAYSEELIKKDPKLSRGVAMDMAIKKFNYVFAQGNPKR